MDAGYDRLSSARAGSPLEQWEWLFPLRGRWLRMFLGVFSWLGLLIYLITGLVAAGLVPSLASGHNIRVKATSKWYLEENIVFGQRENFKSPTSRRSLQLGSLRVDFDYPKRAKAFTPEALIRFLFSGMIFGLPLLIVRKIARPEQFRAFRWQLGIIAVILLFPSELACGGAGRVLPLWHFIYYDVIR